MYARRALQPVAVCLFCAVRSRKSHICNKQYTRSTSSESPGNGGTSELNSESEAYPNKICPILWITHQVSRMDHVGE